MRRPALITASIGVLVAALIWWIASNTSWVEVKVPAPLRGEARVNPFYAAQRFAEGLGARTSWDHRLIVPRSDAVVVLSAWHWTVNPSRERALKGWVESGGRLVVDGTLIGGDAAFEDWSGIRRRIAAVTPSADSAAPEPTDRCITVQEQAGSPRAAQSDALLCDVEAASSLTTNRDTLWGLRGTAGLQAVRVRVGAGTVTRINAPLVRHLKLFDGDHGAVFVAASGLRRGDDVHFLSEADYPSLLTVLWRSAAPVVLLALTVVALWVWRDGMRFGPVAAPPARGRRSLADQIRGTGHFVSHYGSAHILYAAGIRAFEHTAGRRVPGYARMSREERTATLSRLTRMDPAELAGAFDEQRSRSLHQMREAIAVVETARRGTLAAQSRRRHGLS